MKHPNILQIHIEEPTSDPAQPSRHHLLSDDIYEAEKRYRTLIRVLISQLTGLNNTDVQFIVSPADPEAIEAVSFWILPLLRGNITKLQDHFHFIPEQNASEFSIQFTSKATTHKKRIKSATLTAHCPQCSSRWINTAMMQCTETCQVIGTGYLTISHHLKPSQQTISKLPELPVIKTNTDWLLALESPIGPKLKKFYEEL